MKEKTKKIILIIIMFIFVLAFLETISFAVPVEDINTDNYKTGLDKGEANYLFKKSAKIIATLRNIAAIISVFVITILGIKYMLGSLEERAEYKKTMIPIVVGCILVCSISTILTVIQSIF